MMAKTSDKKQIFFVNELTLIRLLATVLVGGRPFVVDINPMLPPLLNVLTRIVEWLTLSGRASWVIDLIPQADHLWEYPTRTLMYDVFGQTEQWHNRFYNIGYLDKKFDRYGMCYKQISCNYAKPKHFHILILGMVLEKYDPSIIQLYGLQKDTRELYTQYWKERQLRKSYWTWRPALVLNLFICCVVTSYTLAFIFSRTRGFRKPNHIFRAADYGEDPRDFPLYHELSEGGEVLLVLRNTDQKVECYNELKPYKVCKPDCGWFNPVQACQNLWLTLSHGLKLFRLCSTYEPSFYFQLAALPYRRLVIRSLFNRYRPSYFWGRDDYNVEHILRRQEINLVGGKSYGLQHGFTTSAIIYPMWRYLNFDRYYVAGLASYNYCYKDTWAEDMKVIPIGTFGAKREDYDYIHVNKPKDIIVFTGMGVGDPDLVKFIRDLAVSLPDRNVLLQVKHNFIKTTTGALFIESCIKGIPNILTTKDSVFKLFRKGKYIFSDPSTVISEALKMGLMAFTIDVIKYQRSSIFRQFEGMCMSNGSEAGAKIRDIEAQRWPYPRIEFGALSDLSETVFFDVIRVDVGLEKKQK
ncbi:MAG: hypothetical protein VX617_06190 [Pseudomonadota bacterium]|nr:hypothetical protein [Pseudomonadota bacterium]